jgi:hypothetical protein
MALSDGNTICPTCTRRFWPQRDRQRYGCDYCARFPEDVRIAQLDHQRYPRTRATRPLPTFDSAHCTCPEGTP